MCLFVENRGITTLTPKRRKAGLSVTSKEKREKFGERIVALHELVSPFGKTDTASVLYNALDYIKFLQEQVEVLTAPYLCSSTPAAAYMIQEEEEAYRYSLRSKGLLLVPASSTTPSKTDVVSSNGIWDIVPLPAENSKRNSDGTVDKYIAPLVSK